MKQLSFISITLFLFLFQSCETYNLKKSFIGEWVSPTTSSETPKATIHFKRNSKVEYTAEYSHETYVYEGVYSLLEPEIIQIEIISGDGKTLIWTGELMSEYEMTIRESDDDPGRLFVKRN